MRWSIRDLKREAEREREFVVRIRGSVETFVERALPGEVDRVEVNLGLDHDDSPALFIDLFVEDDQHPSVEKVELFTNAISELQLAISLDSEDYFPYINLREAKKSGVVH